MGDTAKKLKTPPIGPALSWDEVADHFGPGARTYPMDKVFNTLAQNTHKFYVHPENDTIHLIIKEEET